MKGHENDEDAKNVPSSKVMASLSKSKSSPFQNSEPPKEISQNSIPFPPSWSTDSPNPLPFSGGLTIPVSTLMTTLPIGVDVPVGRRRVSKRSSIEISDNFFFY